MMDNRENDTVIKKFSNCIKEKTLTEEEHKRAMSKEFDYLDEDEDNE